MRVKLTLVLISDRANVYGPLSAGAGEISLIESWACGQVFPVKRLPLTRADAQPEAFLNRLQCALDGIVHLEVSHRLPIEDRVADLVNAILDVPSDFALMISGYDVVEAQSVHALMGRILDYQPPQMHLYMITPVVPPLPNLLRLRVRREVLQVTWPEAIA
jgi:LuxR family transcriptional regulator, maltose regulon positive regulatory protein